MSGNEAFEYVTERGWTRGLPTMLRSGLSRWFKTRMWWSQSLIWVLLIVGILSMVAFNRQPPPGEELLMLFCVFAGLFPTVGVIIIMQDALVGEKREGTAAWVLSKPLTRPAFVFSKIISNSIGILLTMVLIPCILSYIVFVVHDLQLNVVGYIEGMGVIFISHFYFLALTLMLGALFSGRGPVIGIPLGILFLQQNIISVLPSLRFILPWMLVIPLGNTSSLTYLLMTGAPIPTEMLINLAFVVGESILFILVALWRFNREEF
jgi:ABC-type transport system involved in multi-copper enzyme maturation permease subunit